MDSEDAIDFTLSPAYYRDNEPVTPPERVIGRFPWVPALKTDLQQSVARKIRRPNYAHAYEQVAQYQNSPVEALELPGASEVHDVAEDAIDELWMLRKLLTRKTEEIEGLWREIARLRAALEDAEKQKKFQPSVNEVQQVVPEAAQEKDDRYSVILNWTQFQRQLHEAQMEAAKLRNELALREGLAERLMQSEEIRRQLEKEVASLKEDLVTQSKKHKEEIDLLNNAVARLTEEIERRVPRDEVDSIRMELERCRGELNDCRAQAALLEENLRRELERMERERQEAEMAAREREARLTSLLQQASDEQNRLLKQLSDAERELLPEMREELDALRRHIKEVEDARAALAMENEQLKEDVEAAEALAIASEQEREEVQRQLDEALAYIKELQEALADAEAKVADFDALCARLRGLEQAVGDLTAQLEAKTALAAELQRALEDLRKRHTAQLAAAEQVARASAKADVADMLIRCCVTNTHAVGEGKTCACHDERVRDDAKDPNRSGPSQSRHVSPWRYRHS